MKKRLDIVLNIFLILLVFFSHWYVLWSIMTTIMTRTWELANYNLLVFNWLGKISLLDPTPLLLLLMLTINIFLYAKEKE